MGMGNERDHARPNVHAAPPPEPVTIHYGTRFDGKTPVLCRSTDLNTPATSDPRYVWCADCLALMTDSQREMRRQQVERYG